MDVVIVVFAVDIVVLLMVIVVVGIDIVILMYYLGKNYIDTFNIHRYNHLFFLNIQRLKELFLVSKIQNLIQSLQI